MRIAYCTVEEYVESASLMASGYANLPMLERMPVDLHICIDIEDVRQCARDMDVILLELPALLDYRHKLGFLNGLPVFVAGFHLDSWKGPFWCDEIVNVDLNICIYREVTLRIKPEIADSFLWLPPRVQLYDMAEKRDLDVILWGAMGREYTFRNFVFYAMLNLLTAGPRVRHPGIKHEHDNHVRTEPITLGGKGYRLARIMAKYGQPYCHGAELAEILSRAKVCPTGPPIQINYAAPVARYIENAACGVVALTSDFDEKHDLGFEHGKNVWITTAERFFPDLEYLLTNHDHWLEISQNARALVQERHTVDVRAKQLYEVLKDRTGIA